jgi:hypothetical protein
MICLCSFTPAHAATGSISGVQIVKVWHNSEATRGPGGRAWVTLSARFNTVGNCVYMGGIDSPPNWGLEFQVEHGSFKAMYAQALTAYSTKSLVTIHFDDGFAGATTCRITSIILE